MGGITVRSIERTGRFSTGQEVPPRAPSTSASDRAPTACAPLPPFHRPGGAQAAGGRLRSGIAPRHGFPKLAVVAGTRAIAVRPHR